MTDVKRMLPGEDGFMKYYIQISMMMVGLVISMSGCESGGMQTMSVRPSSAVKSPATARTENPAVVQSEYDARIAAQTGRSIRPRSNDFQQVSMFGDLPGNSELPFQVEPAGSLQQHTFATEGACFDPRISIDGKWMAFASTQHTIKPDIYIKQVNSTAMTQLTNNPASDVQPAFSCDSRRLAFSSDRTGNWDIFIVDRNGRNLQQLTDDPAPEMHPSFSPDGRKLAYCRYNTQTRQWEIWLLDMNNPGQRKFLAVGVFPNYSPKDSQIVYQRPTQRGSQLFGIWMITLDQDDQPSMPTEIASSSDRALIGPQWSMDGKKLAYCSVRPEERGQPVQDSQVWVVQVDGQGRMPMTDPGIACFSPTWGSDGRIFFCAKRSESENIWSILPPSATVPESTAENTEKSASMKELEIPDRVELSKGENEVSGLKSNQPVHLPGETLQVDHNATVEVQDR